MSDIKHPTPRQVAYMKRNINKVPFHIMRDVLRVNTATMYEWFKNIYQPGKQVLVNDEGEELHSTYLVTLNGFNYVVNFSTAVEYPTIQYCGHLIGFDYEVSKLGYWEFNHLRHNIPCINIKTDANYVSNFWATTKLWSE